MTRCIIRDCDRPVKSRKLCNTHYTKFERGDLEHPEGLVVTDLTKILRQCKYMMRKRPDGDWERRANGATEWQPVVWDRDRRKVPQ